MPRRLTHVVAPSPVRRTDASARSRWKRSRSVRVARGRSGQLARPPAAPAGPRQTHPSHAVAGGGGGGEVHPHDGQVSLPSVELAASSIQLTGDSRKKDPQSGLEFTSSSSKSANRHNVTPHIRQHSTPSIVTCVPGPRSVV